MKYEKTIKDLKELNYKLKSQNGLLEIRNIALENKLKELEKQYKKEELKLLKDNQVLQNRIIKALVFMGQYIVNFDMTKNWNDYEEINVYLKDFREFYNILKGE